MKFILIVSLVFTFKIFLYAFNTNNSHGFDIEGKEFCRSIGDMKRIIWVHVPKCGSSLSLALQHMSCPYQFEEMSQNYVPNSEIIAHGGVYIPGLPRNICNSKFRDIPNHGPMCPHDFDKIKNGDIRFVTVLRNPADRMHSARRYNFMIITNDHDARANLLQIPVPGESQAVIKAMNAANIKFDRTSKLFKKAIESYRYQSSSILKGVYTKTLIGRWSSDNNTVSQADVDLAISNIEKFYFVGIFEEWNNTIKCYLDLESNALGYLLNITQLDLLHVRPTAKDEELEKVISFFPPFIDAYDDQVYEAAKRIYNSTCRGRGYHLSLSSSY